MRDRNDGIISMLRVRVHPPVRRVTHAESCVIILDVMRGGMVGEEWYALAAHVLTRTGWK